jgi:hypothetical protein
VANSNTVVRWLEPLRDKLHLAHLLKSLNVTLASEGVTLGPQNEGPLIEGSRSRPLISRDRNLGPHSVITIAASVAAGAASAVLSDQPPNEIWGWLLASFVAGTALCFFGGRFLRLILAAAGLLAIFFHLRTETTAPVLITAIVPWITLSVTVIAFRAQSYVSLHSGWKFWLLLATVGWHKILLAALGIRGARALGVKGRGSKMPKIVSAARRLGARWI